jgi:protein-tyrosine phosphatase
MIDFHSHILPGIDDGAITIDDSLAMARSLSAFGYKTVCCTPHCIKGYYDLTSERVREATLRLQADLDNADIDLELRPGMEYMLDECFVEYAEDLQPLGDTRLILCEAPQLAHPGFVQEGLELILDKGFVPLVAHPERTEYFHQRLLVKGEGLRVEGEAFVSELLAKPSGKSFFKRLFSRNGPKPLTFNPAPLTNLVFLERCLFQANLGSFTNYYGGAVQRRAYEFLKQGVYTALASDLHDNSSAPKVLAHDKFAINPLLKNLSVWDGVAPPAEHTDKSEESGQGELF